MYENGAFLNNEVAGREMHRLSDRKANEIIRSKIDVDKVDRLFQDLNRDSFVSSHRSAVLSFARLILELKERTNDFDTLLSDEVSGRFPTLILWNIFSQKRSSEGNSESMKVFFVPGGHHYGSYAFIKEYFQGKSIQKALLVSEFVETGRGTSQLSNELLVAQVPHEVAIISVEKLEALRSFLVPCIYGAVDTSSFEYWHGMKKNFLGVEKNLGQDRIPEIKRIPNMARASNYSRRILKDIADEFTPLVM